VIGKCFQATTKECLNTFYLPLYGEGGACSKSLVRKSFLPLWQSRQRLCGESPRFKISALWSHEISTCNDKLEFIRLLSQSFDTSRSDEIDGVLQSCPTAEFILVKFFQVSAQERWKLLEEAGSPIASLKDLAQNLLYSQKTSPRVIEALMGSGVIEETPELFAALARRSDVRLEKLAPFFHRSFNIDFLHPHFFKRPDLIGGAILRISMEMLESRHSDILMLEHYALWHRPLDKAFWEFLDFIESVEESPFSLKSRMRIVRLLALEGHERKTMLEKIAKNPASLEWFFGFSATLTHGKAHPDMRQRLSEDVHLLFSLHGYKTLLKQVSSPLARMNILFFASQETGLSAEEASQIYEDCFSVYNVILNIQDTQERKSLIQVWEKRTQAIFENLASQTQASPQLLENLSDLIHNSPPATAQIREVFLGEIEEKWVRARLEKAEVLTQSVFLTLMPVLNLAEEYRPHFDQLAEEWDQLSLPESSCLEYLLAFQLYLVREASARGYLTPEATYQVLSVFIRRALEDPAQCLTEGTDLKKSFSKRLEDSIRIVLKHSLFQQRPDTQDLKTEDLELWSLFLVGGSHALAYRKNLEWMRQHTNFRGFKAEGHESDAFPLYLQPHMAWMIYLALTDVQRYQIAHRKELPDRIGFTEGKGEHSQYGINGDVSLLGGLHIYGSNLDVIFRSELGHFSALPALPRLEFFWEEKRTRKSITEFDDRTALSQVPPSFETPSFLSDALSRYADFDGHCLELGKRASTLDPADLKKLLLKLKAIDKNSFSSRTEALYARSALWILSHLVYDQATPLELDLMILGRGLWSMHSRVSLDFEQTLLKALGKSWSRVQTLPISERQYLDGGVYVSTLHLPFPQTAAPLQPLSPAFFDDEEKASFEHLSREEGHVLAEWLAYYTKLRARELAARGILAEEEFLPFIHNAPYALRTTLKKALEEKQPLRMTDIVDRIRSLTPEELFEDIAKSPEADLKRMKTHQRFHEMEIHFLAHDKMSIQELDRMLQNFLQKS